MAKLKIGASRRKGEQQRRGVAMIALAVIFFVGLAAAWLLWPQPPCQRSATARFAIMFDATSALSEAQRLDLRNRFQTYIDQIPVGGLVQFWTVMPTGAAVPKPLSEPICKPNSVPNRWIENPSEVKRAHDAFTVRVKTVIETALVSPPQTESPILESIQAIWLRYLGSPDFPSTTNRHLLMASDLVQHVQGLSFYSHVPSFPELQGNAKYQSLKVLLKDTDVEVLYLNHDDKVDVDPLIRLWEAVFEDLGATLSRVERITGR